MPEVVRARGDPADLVAIIGRVARAGCERFLRVPYRSAIAATSARPKGRALLLAELAERAHGSRWK
jgi:hypothetical protein